MSAPVPVRGMVLAVLAEDLRRGVTVWAPGDGDWLTISRADHLPEEGTVTVYRSDSSEAQFDHGKYVLLLQRA